MNIVERLRTFDSVPDADVILLLNEAADEIERLREALRFYADPEHYEYKVGDIAVMSNVEWNEIEIGRAHV